MKICLLLGLLALAAPLWALNVTQRPSCRGMRVEIRFESEEELSRFLQRLRQGNFDTHERTGLFISRSELIIEIRFGIYEVYMNLVDNIIAEFQARTEEELAELKDWFKNSPDAFFMRQQSGNYRL